MMNTSGNDWPPETSGSEVSAEPAATAAPADTGAPAETALPEDLRAPWSWADLVRFLVFALASGAVLTWAVALGAVVWFGVSPREMDQSASVRAGVLVVSQALWSGMALVYLFVLVRLRSDRPFWQTLGWRPLPSRRVAGPAATFLCLLGGVGVAVVTQMASALVGKKAKLPIEELFRNRTSVLLLMALGLLVAPLVEETIFRGYIYPVVARRFGVPAGVVATGSLFGMAHALQLWGGWGQIALLVLVGIVFTYVRAHTGTVLASYYFHLGYNGILFLGFYFATGGLRHFPTS